MFKLLHCIKKFEKLSNDLSLYPVGIFEDLTAMFLELASKTPPKIKQTTKSTFFVKSIQSFVQTTKILWNRISIYLKIETI